MRVCECACAGVHCVCECAHVCLCVYECIHVCMSVSMCGCVSRQALPVLMHVRSTSVCVRVHVQVCIVCVSVCVFVCKCVCDVLARFPGGVRVRVRVRV